MGRMLHVTALILLLALAGRAAAAPLEPQKLAAVQAAALDFAALAKDSYVSGQPPRQADPAVKALLDTVFDMTALEAAEPLAFSELGKLNDWTIAVLKVGTVYMLAGTGTSDIAQAAGDPKLAERIERNTADYAPEMGRYLDAQIRVMDAMIRSVAAHLAAYPQELEKPNVKSGLAKIRAGTKQTLVGALTTLLNRGLDDGWRRDRLPALAHFAPTAAKFLEPEDGRAVRQAALDVAETMPDPDVERGLMSLANIFGPG
ncbi:MAG: hypothetical protein ACHQF3_14720 [Alphaproteobacteria bacterium]